MELSNKVRELIYSMFDTMVEGVDKYETKSSTWLIFTDEKKWVLEFTKENILWFNYNTFQSELVLVGMDCADSKDVIKEWFESRFLGIEVENTIQNGVKHTVHESRRHFAVVEDTIQNGVKLLHAGNERNPAWEGIVEDTIQNGVKDTIGTLRRTKLGVDDIIKNGVKHTRPSGHEEKRLVEDTIQNGVKHTNCKFQFTLQGINDAIENGANDTDPETYQINSMVEDTIQNGVKS
jgi:predicted peroxiredoxin